MSFWTDIFITASISENAGPEDGPEEYPAINFINEKLADMFRASPLFLVTPPNEMRQCPSSCFMTATKVFNLDVAVEAIEAAPWEYPDVVQLFIRDEGSERFIEAPLWAIPGKTDAG